MVLEAIALTTEPHPLPYCQPTKLLRWKHSTDHCPPEQVAQSYGKRVEAVSLHAGRALSTGSRAGTPPCPCWGSRSSRRPSAGFRQNLELHSIEPARRGPWGEIVSPKNWDCRERFFTSNLNLMWIASKVLLMQVLRNHRLVSHLN